MKKFVALGILCSLLVGADAVSAVRGRGGASGAGATAAAGATTRGRAPVAGGATNAAAPVAAAPGATSARAATRRGAAAPTTAPGTSGNAVVPAGGAKAPAAKPAGRTGARAATNQKVINTNTKIASATANTVVSEECKTKYYGCMDSFCMLDNTNGGRCVCSNKHAEYETILAEIQKLDQQSYEMATTGVERINMGESAADVDAMVKKTTKSMTDAEAKEAKKKARTLALSAWDDANGDMDVEDLFADGAEDDLTNKTGDALYAAVDKICVKQIPECSGNMNMLKMMYAQQIKSDCGAYENSLKKQKNESAKKLATAQQAMREAALEQYQNANKYDLGQCTLHFKECMQTTAGCGEDFSQCASIVARENAKTTNYGKNKKAQEHVIKTGATQVSITASTYDTLLGKKTICETVTKQCQKVKDKVWDAFLLDIAPSLKAAELTAESDLRMNCVANISECFQKACKDTMDPNDPDGSYDMCLTRPETMRSVCKVQIDPCEQAEPKIFDYVKARLASMRVDSCTKEVKACLTADDRCGKDYVNCVGMDLASIRGLCPLEKLVGCQKDGQDAAWAAIDNIVQGIYLNIDNSLLNQCVNIVNAKYAEICGDNSSECDAFDSDNDMGTESLMSHKENDGTFVIEGLLSFYNVKIKEVETSKENVKFGKYELDINDYAQHLDKLADAPSAAKERVLSSLRSVQSKINQKMAILTSDEKVGWCVYGRDVKQIRSRSANDEIQRNKTQARFPHLLDSSFNAIVSAGIDKANANYRAKFNEILAEVTEKQSDEVKSAMCAAMASSNAGLKCKKTVTTTASGFRRLGLKRESSVTVCEEYETVADQALGLKDNGGYDVKLVLGGMQESKLLQMQSKGKETYIQKDKDGNMISQIIMSAVYSPDSNVCKLTSTTQVCKNMQAVYDTYNQSDCASSGLLAGGGCGNKGSTGGGGVISGTDSHTENQSTFRGTICSEMSEPKTTVQDIKM